MIPPLSFSAYACLKSSPVRLWRVPSLTAVRQDLLEDPSLGHPPQSPIFLCALFLPPEQTSFKVYTFPHIGEGVCGRQRERLDSGWKRRSAGLIEERNHERKILHAKIL